jgi:hypothetical protein
MNGVAQIINSCGCALRVAFTSRTFAAPPAGGRRPIVSFPSGPLPQRNEGLDTIPPQALIGIPKPQQFQTFWAGNQLPGINTLPSSTHTAWIAVRGQDQTVPQLRGGAFGRTLGQVSSSRLVERWHQLWTAQSS